MIGRTRAGFKPVVALGFQVAGAVYSPHRPALTAYPASRRAKLDAGFSLIMRIGIVIGETAEIGDDCISYITALPYGVSWDKGKRHPTSGAGRSMVGAGAKIPAPVYDRAGAKIGSKFSGCSCRAACNVVGIPARIVEGVEEGVGGQVSPASTPSPPMKMIPLSAILVPWEWASGS
jgi:serine O-acetyltransferase